MNEYENLGIKFENFCREMFKELGYNLDNNNTFRSGKSNYRPDIIISNNDISVIIDVKIYRTIRPDYSMLIRTAGQLKSCILNKTNTQLVILIANSVNEDIKNQIKASFGIIIIDKTIIENSIQEYPSLLNSFYYFTSCIPQPLNPSQSTEKINQIIKIPPQNSTINKIIYNQQYQTFEKQLKNIKPGRKDASKYEQIITDILKYLFEKDLAIWATQLMTDDGLYKYDLVCRINPGNTFWDSLISDFHSRYVVFEYKNYNEPIKQTQIYTTEKYLYKTALRSVCFMIARNGAEKNAIKASKGVLRETGKLLLVLSEEDLLEMIKYKDNGTPPTDYLYELLDNYLLKIEK